MAGFISKETIELVNSTTDIISLVGDYTKLERRTGNDWWGCCPFHNEKSASFHVDGDKKFYYCFGCHASGNAISFVMEMEKVDFSNAVESLAKKGGIQIKYENGYKPEEKKVDNFIQETKEALGGNLIKVSASTALITNADSLYFLHKSTPI